MAGPSARGQGVVQGRGAAFVGHVQEVDATDLLEEFTINPVFFDGFVTILPHHKTGEMRILDFSQVVSGPFATSLLTLMGAEVIIENYRPGVMARLGVGFDAVQAIKPVIIYCSISGYGQEGPDRDAPAYDGAVQAAAGVMSITGYPDHEPGRCQAASAIPLC